ncbi:MAG: PfkB family carbohydrate kinase, partial [Anaerolineae bacterium]
EAGIGVRGPDFLVIGHLTKDLGEEGYALGGTALYSTLTARNLGRKVAVVTSAGPNIELELLEGVDLLCLPSPTTTTFRNIYGGEHRSQFLYCRASPIGVDAVPLEWRELPIVHLGPVAQELGEEMAWLFPHSLLCLTPQGWLRRWDEEGRVHPQRWEGAEKVLPSIDLLIVSEDDMREEAASLRQHLDLPRISVVTQGAQGATLYHKGKRCRFPAPQARTVDPTGAGDIFAAAFLVRLAETGNLHIAARFANTAASLSIERIALSGIPTRAETEERLEASTYAHGNDIHLG